MGNEFFGGLFVVRWFVDEEDSAGGEEVPKDLQRVENVGECAIATDVAVVIPVAASVDEGVSAADECVELLVGEEAGQFVPLRENRLVSDDVLREILAKELQHLRVAVRRCESESAFHQGDVEGSATAAGVEDGGGGGDVVMDER